jgi:hypothetical protein
MRTKPRLVRPGLVVLLFVGSYWLAQIIRAIQSTSFISSIMILRAIFNDASSTVFVVFRCMILAITYLPPCQPCQPCQLKAAIAFQADGNDLAPFLG